MGRALGWEDWALGGRALASEGAGSGGAKL